MSLNLSVFKGRQAEYNKRILWVIALEGPLHKFDVWRKLATKKHGSGQGKVPYPTVSRRIDDLFNRGYLVPQQRMSPHRRREVKAYGLAFKSLLVSTKLLRTREEEVKILQRTQDFLLPVLAFNYLIDTRFLLDLWLALLKEKTNERVWNFLYKEPIAQQFADANFESADEEMASRVAKDVRRRLLKLTCPENGETGLQEDFFRLFTTRSLIQRLTIQALKTIAEEEVESFSFVSYQILASMESLKEKLIARGTQEKSNLDELRTMHKFWTDFLLSLIRTK